MRRQTIPKIFIILLISIVVIISGIYLATKVMDQESNSNSEAIFIQFLIVSILFSFFLLVCIYVTYLLVRTFSRLVKKLAGFSGNSIPVQLISLGLVAFIFPVVIRQVVIAPVSFFLKIVSFLIGGLSSSINDINSEIGGVDFAMVLRLTFNTLQDSWAFFYNAAIKFLYDLRIPDLILAIAVWVIIGQLLGFILEQESKQQDSPRRLVGLIQKIKPVTRQHVWLTLVFIISAYLSMASIIAIPWLKQGDYQFQTDWTESLQGIVGTRDNFYQRFGDNYSRNPFDSLADSFFVAQLAQDSSAQWQKLVNKVKYDRKKLNGVRADLIKEWQQYRDEIWKQNEKLLNAAINNFRDNMSMMGPQEQNYYFREISRWLRSRVERINNFLSSYQAVIERYDAKFESWIADAKQALRSDLAKIRSLSPAKDGQSANVYFETFSLFNPAHIINETIITARDGFRAPDPGSLPDPPKPGSQWGIFGMISGWLLRTNSYALILITGMLGFGLFGSVISSFVREYGQRKPGEPFVKDLASAVIRGLSAAVVVFLAVKGGLAVFTNQEVEPNSYVLFFTCLVGAVFSENIWEWAREQLKEKFATNDAENAPDQQQENDEHTSN